MSANIHPQDSGEDLHLIFSCSSTNISKSPKKLTPQLSSSHKHKNTKVVIEKKKVVNRLQRMPLLSRTIVNQYKPKEVLTKNFAVKDKNIIPGPLKCDIECMTLVQKRAQHCSCQHACGLPVQSKSTKQIEAKQIDTYSKEYVSSDKACEQTVHTQESGVQVHNCGAFVDTGVNVCKGQGVTIMSKFYQSSKCTQISNNSCCLKKDMQTSSDFNTFQFARNIAGNHLPASNDYNICQFSDKVSTICIPSNTVNNTCQCSLNVSTNCVPTIIDHNNCQFSHNVPANHIPTSGHNTCQFSQNVSAKHLPTNNHYNTCQLSHNVAGHCLPTNSAQNICQCSRNDSTKCLGTNINLSTSQFSHDDSLKCLPTKIDHGTCKFSHNVSTNRLATNINHNTCQISHNISANHLPTINNSETCQFPHNVAGNCLPSIDHNSCQFSQYVFANHQPRNIEHNTCHVISQNVSTNRLPSSVESSSCQFSNDVATNRLPTPRICRPYPNKLLNSMLKLTYSRNLKTREPSLIGHSYKKKKIQETIAASSDLGGMSARRWTITRCQLRGPDF